MMIRDYMQVPQGARGPFTTGRACILCVPGIRLFLKTGWKRPVSIAELLWAGAVAAVNRMQVHVKLEAFARPQKHTRYIL